VKLNIPGNHLKNIFYLRSFDDCLSIIEESKNARSIVVIGGSFIGMETAFSLHKRRNIPVTVVVKDDLPFKKVFGKEIGNLFLSEHQKTGTKFILKTEPVKFEGEEKVTAVKLNNGESIEADLVLIGIGVRPAAEFIKGIELQDDGSIKTNSCFEITEDVYAAGDIAKFPYWYNEEYTRIEHWRTAEQQGRIAALNMSGNKKEFKGIPFFWTSQAGITLNYIGYTADWDEIIIQGDISSKNFIAFYIKNKKMLAAASCDREKEMTALHELMRLNKAPSISELKKKDFNPENYLRNIQDEFVLD
jgi:NADPH-dependent 2,4-dienoyl-CoA reductase/sulfur reductase-like enzyme